MKPSPNPAAGHKLDDMQQMIEHLEQVSGQVEQIHAGLARSHRLTTLGTLASILAHEFNNILTPISSYAQMALKNPDDAALVQKALTRAVEGVEQAARVSSSVLGFASEELEDAPATLANAVEQAIACLGRDLSKDGITLKVDLPDVQVSINATQLQQVLLNLLLNARKAMLPRGGSLRISAQVMDDAVRLDVADTGPGIPASIMHRLFEPFATCATDTTDDFTEKGTGLGLCICKQLIEQAGGTINVDSAPNQGATFHLHLPLVQDANVSGKSAA